MTTTRTYTPSGNIAEPTQMNCRYCDYVLTLSYAIEPSGRFAVIKDTDGNRWEFFTTAPLAELLDNYMSGHTGTQH